MKTKAPFFPFAALLIFGFSGPWPLACAGGKKEVWKVASLEYPPYAAADLPGGGSSIAKLRKLLQSKNIELQVDYLPWKRVAAMSRKGKYVGYFPSWPQEVQKGFWGSGKVDESFLLLAANKNSLKAANLEEALQKGKTGHIDSYTYPKKLEKLFKEHPKKAVTLQFEKSMLKMLNSKRLDYALTEKNVLEHYMKDLSLKNIHPLKIIGMSPLVLAIFLSRENQKKIELFKEIQREQSQKD